MLGVPPWVGVQVKLIRPESPVYGRLREGDVLVRLDGAAAARAPHGALTQRIVDASAREREVVVWRRPGPPPRPVVAGSADDDEPRPPAPPPGYAAAAGATPSAWLHRKGTGSVLGGGHRWALLYFELVVEPAPVLRCAAPAPLLVVAAIALPEVAVVDVVDVVSRPSAPAAPSLASRERPRARRRRHVARRRLRAR